MSGTVNYETRGDVAWITIANSAKANCLSRSMLHTMTEHLARAAADEAIGAVVVTSDGSKCFSAGMDVNEFRGLDPRGAYELIDELGNACEAIRTHRKPIVMAIKGYCIGGAMEMCIAADIRVASTTATFVMPEIQLGIPSVLDSVLLADYIGLALTKEMLLTGDPVDADRMFARGFINALVDVDDVEMTAESMAKAITKNHPQVVEQQKRLFNTWDNTSLDVAYADSKKEFSLAFTTDVPESKISAR